MKAICDACGQDFEAAPRPSPLGLDVLICPHCQAKVVYPLRKWRRFLYLILLAPGAALVGYVGWALTHAPEDVPRGVGYLWIPIVSGLMRDRYLTKRLQNIEARTAPVERVAMAQAFGSWKKSPEFGITWAVIILTYAPLFFLGFRTTRRIHDLTAAASSGFKTGNYKASAAALDQLIAFGLAKKAPEIIAQRGYARALAGDLEPALKDADEALKRNPGSELGLVTRCVAEDASKAWDKALVDCADADKKLPPGKNSLLMVVRSRLASAKFSTADYVGAQAEYSSVLELSSTTAAAYLNRAMVAVIIGPKEQGQADLKRAMELAPTLTPDKLGPAGMLFKDDFEPLIPLGLRRGRDALAALAGLELARYQASQSWATSVDDLISGNPAADSVKTQLAAAFEGGTASIATASEGLAISGKVKGSKREVAVQGGAAGFVIPEQKWENGVLPEQRIDPPKPKPKPKAKKKTKRR